MKRSDFRVAFVSPPIAPENLHPLLLQNRQFKFSFSENVRIYPLIPSHFITNCYNAGFKTLFLDNLVQGLNWHDYVKRLIDFNPHIVVIETKAPVIKLHGAFINYMKKELENTLFAVTGDHVTAFPEKSLNITNADFAIPSGDWDWQGLQLCEWLYKKAGAALNEKENFKSAARSWIKENPSGNAFAKVAYGTKQKYIAVGPDKLDTPPLGSLPWINRDLTEWSSYGEAYLLKPVAYILSGRGCGGSGVDCPGKCIFCVWQHTLWNCTARLRPPKDVAAEIKMLYEKYGVAEVFDDNESGPCWSLEWLEVFADEMERLGIAKKVRYSCNARADSLDELRLKLMERAGFRLLKVGFESGSQRVLDKLSKDETLEQIVAGIKAAKDHGLRVLFTNMVGYPWEETEDAEKTWKLARELLLYKAGFGDSLQASVCVPYPGTPLWKMAIKNRWLLIDPKDLSGLSMDEKVLKSPVDTTYWVRRIWRLHLEPEFLVRSFLTIRTRAEINLAFRGFMSLLGHLRDYDGKKETSPESPPWIKDDDQNKEGGQL